VVARLVPHDGDVEGSKQRGFERLWQAGEDIAGVRDLIEQRGVHGRGGRGLQGGEPGFGFGALGVELGEAFADAGAHRGGGRVAGIGGQFAQCGDLGVLLGVEFADGGLERGGFGVAAAGGFGVGGGGSGIGSW
jgi:hypothetical protein